MATNLARRTTTSVGKRRDRVGDVFTAFYSTILATAAVADMRVKDERRKQWDRAIAEARAGTPTHEPGPGQPNSSIDSAEFDGSSASNTKWTTTAASHEPVDGCNWTAKPNSVLEKLRIAGSWVEDELSVVGDRPDPELPAREPLKPLHLEMKQEVAARLIYLLLKESKIFSAERIQGTATMQSRTLQMKDRLQSLLEGFGNLPLYKWNDLDEVNKERDALHKALWTICWNTAPNDRAGIRLALAKICYNLLVSTTPLTLVTYQILLTEFNRLGNSHLAQIVVNSFIHESRLKPTRTTVKLILDHYHAKGDSRGFWSIVQRMRAARQMRPYVRHDHPDMMIQKRQLKDMHKPSVQEWRWSTQTVRIGHFLYQKTPRDVAIFDSLIKGSLDLLGLAAALRHIRSAFREGHQVYEDTLRAVIRACLNQANYKRGLSLLRTIISLWEDGVGHVAIVYSEDLRQVIYQLLVMCGFDTSLNSKKDLPIKASWDALQDMLHFMHLESLNEALDRCADFTFSLGQSLGLIRYGETTANNESPEQAVSQQTPDIDLAMQVVEDYATEQQRRIEHQKGLEIAGRWTRLDALKVRVDHQSARNLEIEKQLMALLYDIVSRDLETLYDDDAAALQMNTLSPNVAYVEKCRLLLNRLQQSVSKPAVVERSPLPSVRELSVALIERPPNPLYGACSSPAKSLPNKPLQLPFPLSTSLIVCGVVIFGTWSLWVVLHETKHCGLSSREGCKEELIPEEA